MGDNFGIITSEFHIARKLNMVVRCCGAPRPHPLLEYPLRRAGFWEASQLCDREFDIDYALVSALLDRWHPETHTFHLPYGEAKITLEDVALQLGLHVDGAAVSGCIGGFETFYGRTIWDLCDILLGAIPPIHQRDDLFISISWFESQFPDTDLVPTASPILIERHARAYILRLLGGFLFPDKSSVRVHLKFIPLLHDLGYCGSLSWGSAVLACFDRNLCRAMKYTVTNIGGLYTVASIMGILSHSECMSPRI